MVAYCYRGIGQNHGGDACVIKCVSTNRNQAIRKRNLIKRRATHKCLIPDLLQRRRKYHFFQGSRLSEASVRDQGNTFRDLDPFQGVAIAETVVAKFADPCTEHYAGKTAAILEALGRNLGQSVADGNICQLSAAGKSTGSHFRYGIRDPDGGQAAFIKAGKSKPGYLVQIHSLQIGCIKSIHVNGLYRIRYLVALR